MQCDVRILLRNSACFSCVPKGFFLPLKLSLLSQIATAKGITVPDIPTLLQRASCFSCLSEGEMQLARLQLLCNILGGNTIYYSDGPIPDANVVPGDPLFPPVVVDGVLYPAHAYSLSAVYTPGVGTVLSWTSPFSAAGDTTVIPIAGLFLQQSSIANNLPNNNFSLYWVYTTTRDAPFPELDWTTIKQWGPATRFIDLPTTYTDSTMPPTNGYRVYRLIAMFGSMSMLGSITPPGSHKWEIDWNSVTVVTPFTLNATANPGGGTKLTWTSPKLAFPFATWSFVSSQNPGCPNAGYNHVIIVPPSSSGPQPVNYRVYKSHLIFNPIPEQAVTDWQLVGDFGPGLPVFDNRIYDDCDTDSPAWYRVEATLSDGSVIISSTVGGTH